MPHSIQLCILSRVRDNALENYLGHDIDVSRSRDVINVVIILSAIGHFLLVGNWYQALSQTVFEIFASKYNCVTTLTILCHITSSVT